MAMAMQLVFFLYILVSFTVCDVLKLVNSSVQLDIPEHLDKSSFFFWMFNTSNNIVRYIENSITKVSERYKERVEFNEKSYSLTLKNLQKSDSGIYEAKAVGDHSVIVATYQLKVLDPVEKPVLNASHQQSDDFCNVTLTCEAQNLSVTSHCYNDTCDMREKKTSGDMFPFLSLYVSNNSIICNHSNPVSWKNTTMEIKHVKDLCSNKEIKPKDTTVHMKIKTIISPVIVVFIIFLVIIVIFVFCCQKKEADCQNRKTDAMPDSVNTIYEEVDAKNKGGKKAESVEMSENHAAPSTVYYTVGMQAPTYSNDESTGMDTELPPSYSKFCETHQYEGGQWNADSVDLPQTIYSTVNKPGKPVREA